MANIKSQIKRNKTEREGAPAQQGRQVLAKTAIRKAREAVAAGDAEKAARPRRDASAQARQGRQQGRHPQEPGRQPEVGDGPEGRRPSS